MDVASGIKDILVSAGIGIFAAPTGWSIAISKEPATPDTAITIYNTGGFDPFPHLLLDFPTVQIRVRGAKSGYVASFAKIQAIKDKLLGIPSFTDGAGNRWDSITGQGDIVSIGYDETDRPLHTLNLKLIVEPVAGTNRVSL